MIADGIRFASAECPLCRGLEPDIVVAQDPVAMAVISHRPVNRHHVLILPRRHAESFGGLTAAELAAITGMAQQVSAAIAAVARPDAITLISDDDLTGAGYNLVAHWKLHPIPRFRGEAVQIDWAREEDPGHAVRAGYCRDLRNSLETGSPP